MLLPPKPPRGTLGLHHSKYNDTRPPRKSVTHVVKLKCYPCEWRATYNTPPPMSGYVSDLLVLATNYALA